MSFRRIFILDHEHSPWYSFIAEFFNDTPSKVIPSSNPREIQKQLVGQNQDLVFLREALLSKNLIQSLKAYQQSNPDIRLYELRDRELLKPCFQYDERFEEPFDFFDFQKRLTDTLPFKKDIHVCIVDDEDEVGKMFKDYLGGRKSPSFEVISFEDGHEALKYFSRNHTDVVILDIKMPKMDGRDLYRQLKQTKKNIPVIIFFDAIFGDEVLEIYEIGTPAVVEKGSRESGMHEMMSLIKKMAYFG